MRWKYVIGLGWHGGAEGSFAASQLQSPQFVPEVTNGVSCFFFIHVSFLCVFQFPVNSGPNYARCKCMLARCAGIGWPLI